MKKLKLSTQQCVGCKICELSCSFAHFKAYSHDITNIHIITEESNCDFAPYACIQCQERSCVEACPVQALSVNPETGAIAVNQDSCVFCGLCVKSCEYKGIRIITHEGKKRIAVCDLCGGDAPRCVEACFDGGVTFE